MVTPYEVNLMMEVYREQKREYHNDLLYQAWHIVALDKQKRLPELKDVLIKENESEEKQTAEQMFDKVKQLHVMFGGELINE